MFALANIETSLGAGILALLARTISITNAWYKGRADPVQTDSSEPKPVVLKPKIPPFKVDDTSHWVQKPCQNLSAVLNDPRRHGRRTNFFTSLWGEGFVPHDVVPLTLLPNIPKSYFQDYSKRVEFRYMNHQRLKKTSVHSLQHLAPTYLPGDVGFASAANAALKRQVQGKPADEADSIPEIFLQQNFSLDDPATFNAVLPWSSIQAISSGRPRRPGSVSQPPAKNSAKLLQEKLTHYLDVTEVRLAQQIATKSEDFFSAIASQDKLQDDVVSTCQDVRHLRVQLDKVNDISVKRTLDVMRLFRLRSRYIAVQEKLKLMAAIHQTQPTIQVLLSTSDFVSALDLIHTSQEVLRQELAGVQCFRHLGSQLAEMQNVIERMMEADFVDLAVSTFDKPLAESGDGSTYIQDEDRLLSVVFGLIRQKKFHFLQLYKDEVYSFVKSSIKQIVHATVSTQYSDNEEESLSIGESVRAISHQEWLELMKQVFGNGLQILNKMKVLHESLVGILSLAAGIGLSKQEEDDIANAETQGRRPPGATPMEVNSLLSVNDYKKLVAESRELLWSSCELAQIRCSKLISMRAKGGSLDQLSSTSFVALARLVEGFVTDCERICGKQSHNLRGTLLSQAKRFVEKFHEERKHKLSLILDSERWKQADVPEEFQILVDSVSEGIEGIASAKGTSEGNPAGNGKPTSHLTVRGQKFAVVGTLLLLIKIIIEYCQCVDDVPMLTADILTKLCEIMKIYNSRSCQLVLGAGALKTVGLKTITAKHLALAAQCLEVIILHIPIFKSHFEIRVPPKQYVLLCQFDHILKDYSNHRHEILCKIVSLMEEVFNKFLETWEVRPPMPSSEMRAIVKQFIKLSDTLSVVFPVEQLESLFRNIRRSFRNCLAEKLAILNVLNDGGPQHGLVTSDLAFFADSLKTLPGLKDIGRNFDDLWTSVREIRKRRTSEPVNKLPQR